MKTLILALFLSLTLIVSMPVSAQTSSVPSQEQVQPDQPVVKVNFFEKIWSSTKDGTIWLIIVPFVCGILSKNGITKFIKMVAGKGTIITKELSDVALASSQFFKLLDSAIKEDGTVVQNNLKEAVEAGKTVVAETKDAWVTINPKPATS